MKHSEKKHSKKENIKKVMIGNNVNNKNTVEDNSANPGNSSNKSNANKINEDAITLDGFIDEVIRYKLNSTKNGKDDQLKRDRNKLTICYYLIMGICLVSFVVSLFKLDQNNCIRGYVFTILFIVIGVAILNLICYTIIYCSISNNDYQNSLQKTIVAQKDSIPALKIEASKYLLSIEEKKKEKFFDSASKYIAFSVTVMTFILSILISYKNIKDTLQPLTNTLSQISQNYLKGSLPDHAIVILTIIMVMIIVGVTTRLVYLRNRIKIYISMPYHDYYDKEYVCKQISKFDGGEENAEKKSFKLKFKQFINKKRRH